MSLATGQSFKNLRALSKNSLLGQSETTQKASDDFRSFHPYLFLANATGCSPYFKVRESLNNLAPGNEEQRHRLPMAVLNVKNSADREMNKESHQKEKEENKGEEGKKEEVEEKEEEEKEGEEGEEEEEEEEEEKEKERKEKELDKKE